MNKRYWLLALLIAIELAVVFMPTRAVAQIGYNFGGRIISVFPPIFSPCGFLAGSPAIIVGLPRPGVFIIPPTRSYLFHQWFRPGVKVLGKATGAYCGVILQIGTSLY